MGGAIRAWRHIHMTPSQAKACGVVESDILLLKVDSILHSLYCTHCTALTVQVNTPKCSVTFDHVLVRYIVGGKKEGDDGAGGGLHHHSLLTLQSHTHSSLNRSWLRRLAKRRFAGGHNLRCYVYWDAKSADAGELPYIRWICRCRSVLPHPLNGPAKKTR
jgi:hypothetical protein